MAENENIIIKGEKGALDRFLEDNTTGMRFARTVAQGVIAAAVVFIPTAIGWLDLGAEAASFTTACIMAVLSPVMSLLKKSETIEEVDLEGNNG